MLTRRNFALGFTSGAFAGLALSGCSATSGVSASRRVSGYGPLERDTGRLLDLPSGFFSYRIISSWLQKEVMRQLATNGGKVPASLTD